MKNGLMSKILAGGLSDVMGVWCIASCGIG